MMEVTVRFGTVDEVVMIQKGISEFQHGYTAEEYANRLLGPESLILIAECAGKLVGFKIGYDRFMDGEVFYSWMGGVVDDFRQRGVAKLLLDKMEVWCKLKGYKRLKFKTLNRHRNMLLFAINKGFDVVGFEEKQDPKDSCIYFEKGL